jgi:hypothetical protein
VGAASRPAPSGEGRAVGRRVQLGGAHEAAGAQALEPDEQRGGGGPVGGEGEGGAAGRPGRAGQAPPQIDAQVGAAERDRSLEGDPAG